MTEAEAKLHELRKRYEKSVERYQEKIKAATPKPLADLQKRAARSERAYLVKIKAAEEWIRVTGNCSHADTRTWSEDCDNGYGYWWKRHYEKCLDCGWLKGGFDLHPQQWKPPEKSA